MFQRYNEFGSDEENQSEFFLVRCKVMECTDKRTKDAIVLSFVISL